MASTEPKEMIDVQGDGRWRSMHKRQVENCNLKRPSIVFVGDSLIHRLEDTELWDTEIKPLNAVNAGIGGDCTQHVLWRLQNGLLEKCSPKIVVVLVGTNNHQHTSEEIAEGLETILWSIANVLPETKIILLALLPRGEMDNKLRDKIYQVNYAMERITPTIPNVQFLNADPGFVRADGTISADDMSDYLHMTRRGYKRFYTPVKNAIRKILVEKEGQEKAFHNSIYNCL